MKADELWEKYGNEVLFGADMQVSEDAFRAALAEYGGHVKSEAVKVCREYDTQSHDNLVELAVEAIEKMTLP